MPLKIRPYAGPADLQAVIDLRLACERAEMITEWPSAADLRLLLSDTPYSSDHNANHNQTQPDKVHYISLWEDSDSQLVAMAMVVQDNPRLIFFIHPDHPAQQDPDLETQIITWGIARAQTMVQISPDHKEGLALRIRPRDTGTEFTVLLENLHGEQGDRYTLRLARSLNMPIPDPQLPAGFTIRPVAGIQEVEAYVDLHRAAFGTHNMTIAYRSALMQSPHYRPELDLVAVAPNGTLAAFCVASYNAEENEATGRREGWTDPIGARPAYQRMGLARAVLLAAMQRLKTHGIETAILSTDSWNTPMQRLAESLGFRVFYNTLGYDERAKNNTT